MRCFLALFFVAVTYARPDVGLGYNYNEGLNGVAGIPQAPLVTKHFYLHAAPEERNDEIKHVTIGRPQKNYRVVFIKAPARGPSKIVTELAPQEERTAVYVLAQKEPEIGDIVTPAPIIPSKPDVFFIRYRTPEEAEQAQRQIQAQYDALGGSTQVSDEGQVPVSSVVGSGGGFGGAGAATSPQGSIASLNGGSRNAYLPPSLFRRIK